MRVVRHNGHRAPAIVLALGYGGLSAARSLGRAGVKVIGLDPTPGAVGIASRYVNARHCPSPVTHPDALVEELLDLARSFDEPAVLSPASDSFVLFMSRHRDVLAERYRFNLPSPEVVEAVVDKRQLYELGDRVRVQFPETHYPETMADIEAIRANVQYPVYIKPYHSHLWTAAFPRSGKGIKASTPDELTAGFARVMEAGIKAMVQSIIEGPASNIRTVRVYISPQGELLALMTTRTKRQWPVEFGVGTFVETWRNPEFAELGIGFFRDLGFHGVGTVEFKQDERDGQLKVTDVNPRWWGSLQLGRSSGVDFPLIHYLDLTGQQPAPVLDFREGVRWVDARGDAGSAISQVRAGRLSPVDWLRSWAGARSFSTFALDDPRPFLAKYEYGKVLVGGPRHLWRKRRAAS